MPLKYDLKKIKNRKSLSTKVTDFLIESSLFTGLPVITKENAEEVFLRTALYEQIVGIKLQELEGGEVVDRLITLEDVKKHIGLKTNASKLSATQWYKAMVNRVSLN